jgi:hypothetical protein
MKELQLGEEARPVLRDEPEGCVVDLREKIAKTD